MRSHRDRRLARRRERDRRRVVEDEARARARVRSLVDTVSARPPVRRTTGGVP
jgi:hypothetical protein